MWNELHDRQMAKLEGELERTRTVDLVTAAAVGLVVAVGIGVFLYLPAARTTLAAAQDPHPVLGGLGFLVGWPVVALSLHRWLRRRRAKKLYSG